MNLKSLSVLPSCAFQLIVICAFVSSRSITINESRQLSIESDDVNGRDLVAEESVIERRQGFGTQIGGDDSNGIVGALRTGLSQLTTTPLAVTRTFAMFPTTDGQFLQPTAAGFTINGQPAGVDAVPQQQLQILPIVIPQQQLASQIAPPAAGGFGGFGGVGGLGGVGGMGGRPFRPRRIPPGRLVAARGRNLGRIRALQQQRLQIQRLQMQMAQQRSPPIMQPIIIQTPTASQQRTPTFQPLFIQQAPNTPATIVLPVPIPQTISEPPVRQCGCGASLCSNGLKTTEPPVLNQSCPLSTTNKPEPIIVHSSAPTPIAESGRIRDMLTERERRRRKRRQKIAKMLNDRLV